MSQLYTRNFALAVLSQVGFVMANLMMAHYSRWIIHLGGSVREVGTITGVAALGALLLRPWMGLWLNRLGACRTWGLGYLLFAIGTLGNLFVHDLGWPIYLMRACLFLGVACVAASSLTYISQLSPADRQAEAIGLLGVGGFLGFVIGPLLGDLILGSGERLRSDYVVLFYTAAGALVVPTILLAFLKPTPSPEGTVSVHLGEFVRTIRQYWPGTILLVIFTFGVCITVPLVFLVNFIDDIGLSLPGASPIGIFFLGYSVMGLVVRIGFRRGPDRFGRHKVLLVGLGVMAAGMFSFLFVSAAKPWFLLVPAMLCGTGHGLMFHTGTTLAIQHFPSAVRGTGSALSFILLDLGMLIGAPLLGTMVELWGYPCLFISNGGLCLLAGLLYLRSLTASASDNARQGSILSSNDGGTMPREHDANVRIRRVEQDDLPHVYAMQLDPESNCMAITTPRSREAFDSHWAKTLRDPATTANAILLDDEVVGTIGCFPRDGLANIGYWISREHWGKGIATRALELLLREVPTRPLYAHVATNNGASLRVLQKCGFVVERVQVALATDRYPECEEALLVLRS